MREEETDGSDLDLLVEFTEAPSLFRFIELENLLTAELGVDVDLVMKDALKPRIRQRILQELEPCMSRDRSHADYIQDILDAIAKAEQFTKGMDYEAFGRDDMTIFAVVRAIEIIGEASKVVSDEH